MLAVISLFQLHAVVVHDTVLRHMAGLARDQPLCRFCANQRPLFFRRTGNEKRQVMPPADISRSLKSEITVTSLEQKERSIISPTEDKPKRSAAALNCSSSYRSKLSNCFASQSNSSTFAIVPVILTRAGQFGA